MISNDLKTALGPQKRVTVIIWGALSASVLIYVFVAYVTAGSIAEADEQARADAAAQNQAPPEPVDEDHGALPLILAFMAFSTGALSFLSPKIFLSDVKIKASIATAEVRGEGLSEREGKALHVTSRLFSTALILQLALAESVAIFGLVLSFTTHQGSAIVPFAAGALLLMAAAFPKPEALAARAVKMQ